MRADHGVVLQLVWGCICTTAFQQLWRFRREEYFQDGKRSILKIGITIKRVQDNLQDIEALEGSSRSHDKIAIIVLAHQYMENLQFSNDFLAPTGGTN